MPNNKPAILFLTSWYPVKENSVHGIFIYNHALALSIYTKVVVVYAYSSNAGPFYKAEETSVNENLLELRVKYPKPAFNFPIANRIFQTLKYKKSYRILLNELIKRQIKIKAIQVNIVFPVSIVLSLFKEKFKVQHTIAENWSGYLKTDGNYKGFLMKFFTKKCFKSASKIWHVSQMQKEAMQMHKLTGNFELLYNTVNTKVFKPADEKMKNEKITLLHVSSLVEREKNISGMMRVIKRLAEKNILVELLIAGGNEETISEAKHQAKINHLTNVSFFGTQNPEQISNLMRKSDALILFSFFEGMPVVALEALSCGLPVLATKVGQLPYIINEQFGILAKVSDEEDMLEAIISFINNPNRFNSKAMREFILHNASHEAVGKKLFEQYNN